MAAPKAIIFTHLPIPKTEKSDVSIAGNAETLKNRITPYLKRYLMCRNIALVYIYVDTGIRLTLQHLAEDSDELRFSIEELDFEQNIRNCLKLSLDMAIRDLIHDSNESFDNSESPKFQFIGLPHLLRLIHSLYRIDKNLIRDLAGQGRTFAYDSPKFIEAVIRLSRGSQQAHSHYPILRIDEDVIINAKSIKKLLEDAGKAMQSFNAYHFFSGSYGKLDGRFDPINDYAIRLHWLVNRDTHELEDKGRHFLRDLGEFGATQLAANEPMSESMSDFVKKNRNDTISNRNSQQVISGAGLYMSRTAIRTLPPFMNFRSMTVWIDDHLKRRLHEVLGHIAADHLEQNSEAKFVQDRHPHPHGITDSDIKWARSDYFHRLLSGCIVHSLVTSPNGEKRELANYVDEILNRQAFQYDEN